VARGAKRGFGIPVQPWIAGEWAGAVREALQNSLLAREGWIQSAPALQMLERAQVAGWAPNQLWYLFVLEQWMKNQKSLDESKPQQDSEHRLQETR